MNIDDSYKSTLAALTALIHPSQNPSEEFVKMINASIESLKQHAYLVKQTEIDLILEKKFTDALEKKIKHQFELSFWYGFIVGLGMAFTLSALPSLYFIN